MEVDSWPTVFDIDKGGSLISRPILADFCLSRRVITNPKLTVATGKNWLLPAGRNLSVQRPIKVKRRSASIQQDADRLPPQIYYDVDRLLNSGTRARAYCYKNHQSYRAEKLTKIIHPSQLRFGDR